MSVHSQQLYELCCKMQCLYGRTGSQYSSQISSAVVAITVDVSTGWLRLVGSLKSQVSFAEFSLFYQGSFTKETYILAAIVDVSSEIMAMTANDCRMA